VTSRERGGRRVPPYASNARFFGLSRENRWLPETSTNFDASKMPSKPSLDPIKFEWDASKSRLNEDKHGVALDEARTVCGDPFAVTFDDVEHSIQESRYLTFGLSAVSRALVVAHTDRGDTIRIISARPMTPRERREYEQ
jgi:uncharacterized DUF497 family protein